MELWAIVERIDLAMARAANDAHDRTALWRAWMTACEQIPPSTDIPDALQPWWQSQLVEIGCRAFERPDIASSQHRGDKLRADLSGEPVWTNAPCAYRGREIRVELFRGLQAGSWCASVGIYCERTFSLEGRLFYPDIPDTPAGAVGAYALIIGQVKCEVDRMGTS